MTRRAAPGSVSYSSDCYRTIGGARYDAWSSCPSPDRIAAYRKAGARCRRFGEELFVHHEDAKIAADVDFAEDNPAATVSTAAAPTCTLADERALPNDWAVEWDQFSPPGTIRLNSARWGGCFLRPPEPHDIGLHALAYRLLSEIIATPPAPVSTAAAPTCKPAQAAPEAEKSITMGEAFKAVGGWMNGGDLGYPSFGSMNALWAYTVKMLRPHLASASANQHPDDEAVDLFAAAMKAKMAASRALVRAGFADHGAQEWKPPVNEVTGTLQCRVFELEDLLASQSAPSGASVEQSTPLADLWMHEDMERDAMRAALNAPRQDLKAAHEQAVEDTIYWKRRALTAEAAAPTSASSDTTGGSDV